MSYSLIYTVPFATLDNIPCVVEIEKDGYEGTPTELTAGATPFTVDIEGEEFLYTPTRFSTAKLQVVGNDYLQTLFSTEYRQYRVTFKKAGVITWCGFIKPELYTQDYASETFVLEIECISAMSVLEFIDYTIEGESKAFVSIWRLLQRCISTASGQYNFVFIPHVYASSQEAYSTEENVFASMTLSEQDFFDEDDKPMKLKEVLEEVCKFLNWTCADWKGDLYFVDVDHTGIYHQYDIELENKANAQVNELLVQDIGFAGSNHSLDVLPGYNKASVKCSNYPVGTLLPDEDYSELKELLTVDEELSDHTKVCHSVYLNPDTWDCLMFKDKEILHNKDLESHKNEIPFLEGTSLMKYCIYEQEKNKNGEWVPKISDYSFNNVLRVRYPSSDNPVNFKPGLYKVMSFKGASATYSDGAIAIDGEIKIIEDSNLIPWDDSLAGTGLEDIACQIRIGNKYYGNTNGHVSKGFSWSEDPMTFMYLLDNWNNAGGKDWVSVPNGKTLSMPYTGLKGIIIPTDISLSGDFEFTLISTNKKSSLGGNRVGTGMLIQNFSVKYQKRDDLSQLNNNSDRIYENILNKTYINELDEIEFKISSYNNDGACYSKVMLGNDYLRDNLYNSILDDTIRPEEMLITRCINHYSATRIKLTQEIKERADLSPITRLSDTFLVGKKFINAGGSIDYKMNRFECIMIEV